MHTPNEFRLKADELKALSARTNSSAAWQVLGHAGAIALGGAVLWQALGSWWAVPLTLLQGLFVAFLFNAVHEAAHQTPFRTRAYNHLLGHVAGFAVLLPYEYYRAYHWDHHRYTQDPDRDPELSTPLPTTPWRLAWYWTGLPIWRGRLRMLVVHGLLGRATERWVPPAKQALIVREARCYLLGYAVVIGGSLAAHSLAAVWLWLVPLMAGQVFLRPYLLAEHTGCANNANMLENTRTTYTNAFVRFLAWNMPFHTAHHAYPAVPFHALPRLNTVLAPHLVNAEHGYPASTAAFVRHLLGKAARTDGG